MRFASSSFRGSTRCLADGVVHRGGGDDHDRHLRAFPAGLALGPRGSVAVPGRRGLLLLFVCFVLLSASVGGASGGTGARRSSLPLPLGGSLLLAPGLSARAAAVGAVL